MGGQKGVEDLQEIRFARSSISLSVCVCICTTSLFLSDTACKLRILQN